MGRPAYGARSICESCMLIDVRRWHRKGLLSAGQHFTNSWTFGDEPAGTIGVRTEANAVVLTYRTRSWQAADWKSISQRVPITWTDLHFGGRRPWFICSMYCHGQYCGRRVAVLYRLLDYFACRHCYGPVYESQQEPTYMRGLLKAQKILTRLGARPDIFKPFPESRRVCIGVPTNGCTALMRLPNAEVFVLSWAGIPRNCYRLAQAEYTLPKPLEYIS